MKLFYTYIDINKKYRKLRAEMKKDKREIKRNYMSMGLKVEGLQ